MITALDRSFIHWRRWLFIAAVLVALSIVAVIAVHTGTIGHLAIISRRPIQYASGAIQSRHP